MTARELTEKQKNFCTEYLKDFNATEAYLRAGYKSSRKSAGAAGHRLLKNVEIQAHLLRVQKRVGDRAEITLERTLQEVAYVAYSRITDSVSFNDNDVTISDSATLSDDVLAAIAEVKRSETMSEASTTVTKSVKLHNKLSALNWLGQFFGVGTDFNQARASLKKYGLALIEDDTEDLGWRLERHISDA